MKFIRNLSLKIVIKIVLKIKIPFIGSGEGKFCFKSGYFEESL